MNQTRGFLGLVTLAILCYWADGKPVLFKKHTEDMSYSFNNRTIYWPTGQLARFNHTVRHQTLDGTSVNYYTGDFDAGEHGGTHMDSPKHFNKNGKTIEQIGVERMQAPAVVLDVQDKVRQNPKYEATLDDYKAWEEIHGPMPDDAVFLLCTGWEKNYPDKNKVYGTQNIMDISSMNFPGMNRELVRWLMKNRKLNGIGIDTPTPDGGASIAELPIHIMTAKEDIFILENVKGVCRIPPHGATLLIFPMKIEGGTGAPTRIVATWGDDMRCAGMRSSSGSLLLLAMLALMGVFV